MMRRSSILNAGEFNTKSKWSKVWPSMPYGRMFLPYGAYRTFPMKSVNWVTRDSNRLTNWLHRYQIVRDELDVKRNEEVLKVTLADVRWNDHRKLFFSCGTCGRSYRKYVASATKYHSLCPSCKNKHPTTVNGDQIDPNGPPATLAAKFPDLASQLVGDKKENIQLFPSSSKFVAKWKCACCKTTFCASIRSRTGDVHPGQTPINSKVPQLYKFCILCRWDQHVKPMGAAILAGGGSGGAEGASYGYLGLDESFAEITELSKLPADYFATPKKPIDAKLVQMQRSWVKNCDRFDVRPTVEVHR